MERTSETTSTSIRLVAAISLNGKIADKAGDFSPYSSAEDQQWLQKSIRESDALIMGRKTYDQHISGPLKKPVILFTRRVKGMKAVEDERPLYLFNATGQDLRELIQLLQFQTVTILGGAEIYHWCIQQRIVTDLFITIEPVVIDGGRNLLEGDLLDLERSWKLKEQRVLNDKGSQLLHYHIVR